METNNETETLETLRKTIEDLKRQNTDAEKQVNEAKRIKIEAEQEQAEANRIKIEAEQKQAEAERKQAEAEQKQAEAEREREAERKQAEAERERANKLFRQNRDIMWASLANRPSSRCSGIVNHAREKLYERAELLYAQDFIQEFRIPIEIEQDQKLSEVWNNKAKEIATKNFSGESEMYKPLETLLEPVIKKFSLKLLTDSASMTRRSDFMVVPETYLSNVQNFDVALLVVEVKISLNVNEVMGQLISRCFSRAPPLESYAERFPWFGLAMDNKSCFFVFLTYLPQEQDNIDKLPISFGRTHLVPLINALPMIQQALGFKRQSLRASAEPQANGGACGDQGPIVIDHPSNNCLRVSPDTGGQTLNLKIVRALDLWSGGIVYEVQDMHTSKHAVAKLQLDWTNPPSESLTTEARVLRQLNRGGCPNVPTLLYIGYEVVTQQPLLVTSVVGQPLWNCVPLSEACVVNFYTDIMEALQTMHKLGFFHGDIHPGNIVLTHEGRRAVLIDFGFSGEVGSGKWNTPHSHHFCAVGLGYGLPSCPKFDLESLLYVAAFAMAGTLPWLHLDDTNEIADCKLQFLKGILTTKSCSPVLPTCVSLQHVRSVVECAQSSLSRQSEAKWRWIESNATNSNWSITTGSEANGATTVDT